MNFFICFLLDGGNAIHSATGMDSILDRDYCSSFALISSSFNRKSVRRFLLPRDFNSKVFIVFFNSRNIVYLTQYMQYHDKYHKINFNMHDIMLKFSKVWKALGFEDKFIARSYIIIRVRNILLPIVERQR